MRARLSVRHLKQVTALRRPYMANGLVRQLVANKVGRGNPFLELLRIPPDVYKRPLEQVPDSYTAVIYDSYTVKYAALALPHLVQSGLSYASVHIHRLLDILVASRDALTSLDPKVLSDLMRACERLSSQMEPKLRSRAPDACATQILNAVRQKSLTCASYISTSAAITTNPQLLSEFAAVFARMGLSSEHFTRVLVRYVEEHATLAPTVFLLDSLEYLTSESCRDQKGHGCAIYTIFDVLSQRNVSWTNCTQALEHMNKLRVSHLPFIEAITEDLMDESGDLIGMDQLDSRDLGRIFGLLQKLEAAEHLEAITSTFLNRYCPIERRSRNINGIYRDTGKCGLDTLLAFLDAITTTTTVPEVHALTWLRHILQRRLPYKIAEASAQDSERVFQLLSRLDPGIYENLLLPPYAGTWVYRYGYVNISRILLSMLPSLEITTLENATFCYTMTEAIKYRSIRKIVAQCIHHMCSASIDMLSRSSLITKMTMEKLIETEDDGGIILVEPAKNISSLMIKAFAEDPAGPFLYDPSQSSNFKYMKRGENRPGHSRPPKNSLLQSKSKRCKDETGLMLTPEMNDEDETTEPGAVTEPVPGESSKTLLRSIRNVYRALCVYHHIGMAYGIEPYDMFKLEALQMLQRFIKVYEHVVPLFSTKFSQLDAEFSLYGVDTDYEKKINRVTRENNTKYLDARFLCTPGSQKSRAADKDASDSLRFPAARLRNTSVDIFKPQKAKVKLNWSHFGDPDEAGRSLRPHRQHKLSRLMQAEMAGVSQKVDNQLHGKRDRVEHYNDFLSSHFKEGFAYWSNPGKGEGSSSPVTTNATLVPSRMHKEVLLTLQSCTTFDLKCEVKCGPYYIDINCDHQAGERTRSVTNKTK